jgi:hypothetical protein
MFNPKSFGVFSIYQSTRVGVHESFSELALINLHLTLHDTYHKGQPKGHKNETKVIANMAVATLKKASTSDEQKCSSIFLQFATIK